MMTRKKMQKRFHELVILECTDKATESDIAKLNRYQALLRPNATPNEVRAQSRREYQGQLLIKVTRCIYEFQRQPTQMAIDLLNSRFWELV